MMQILGHSRINLALGAYSHVVPELANAATGATTALWTDARPEGSAQIGCRNGCHDTAECTHGSDVSPLTCGDVGGPPGDRTLNPRIKSPLLCQLS